MYLQYGKVKLTVIDLTRFERDTVWTEDGTDLLYIRNTIGVSAVYSPGGTPTLPSLAVASANTKTLINREDDTYAVLTEHMRGLDPNMHPPGFMSSPILEGDLPPADRKTQFTGPETDVELRAHLQMPRQKLLLWAYRRDTGAPFAWLESPRPDFQTDASNGPKPLSLDIVSASGEPNSIAVHFQVQTDMSPCPVGSDRLVLSHRWQMSHSHDDNYYLTRTITGIIVFNGAVMRLQQINPDFVRAQFIHPVPIGFQRRAPEITQSSDGLTIRYTITDTDPTITFDPGNSGASNIQIIEKMNAGVDRSFAGRRKEAGTEKTVLRWWD